VAHLTQSVRPYGDPRRKAIRSLLFLRHFVKICGHKLHLAGRYVVYVWLIKGTPVCPYGFKAMAKGVVALIIAANYILPLIEVDITA